MRTKAIIIFIIFASMSCRSLGQDKKIFSDDVFRNELKSFLKSESGISMDDSVVIYVVNLMNFKEKEYVPGVYKFGILGAHYLPYIVFISKDGFDIVKNYKTISVLQSFIDFATSSENRYTESQQNKLLKNISVVLYTRLKIIDEISIEEEIEY